MAAGNAVGRHHTHLNRKSSFAGLFVGIRNAAAGAGMIVQGTPRFADPALAAASAHGGSS